MPAPPDYRPPKIDNAPSEGIWIALSEMQMEQLQRESGQFTVGGDLILCQLTKTSITCRKIHRCKNQQSAVEIIKGADNG
jgi:hypothetical protein